MRTASNKYTTKCVYVDVCIVETSLFQAFLFRSLTRSLALKHLIEFSLVYNIIDITSFRCQSTVRSLLYV